MYKSKLPPYDPESVIQLYQLMGYSLFMIQSLEQVLSNYLVFAHKIKPELARDEILKLFDKTEKRTFGSLFSELNDDEYFSEEVKQQIKCLVEKRNWLVHKIHAQNQKDMFSSERAYELLSRVEEIGDEACKLRDLINERTNQILFERNYMSEKELNILTQQILDSWSY